MKILMVNDCPVRTGGGTEQYIVGLCEALRDQGHETYIITGHEPDQPLYTDGTRWFIPGLNAPPLRKRPLKNLGEMLSGVAMAKRLIREIKPDVIHVHNLHNPYPLRAIRKLGPMVKSVHDCRPFCHKPPPFVATRLVGDSEEFCDRVMGPGCFGPCYFSRLRPGASPKDVIEAWSYFPRNLLAVGEMARCDRIIVHSEYQRDLVRRTYGDRLAPDKVEKVFLFSDFEGDPDALSPIPSGEGTILFTGRLTPEKGIRHLLDAVGMIPGDFRVLIAGDGPMRREIEQRIAAMPGKRVRMLGFVGRAELSEAYRSATVVAVPSIGSEGWSLCGLEAFAHGRPVVGYNSGAVGEWLIDGETGFLVPRGDVRGLAEKLHALLEDRAMAGRMGLTGLGMVRDSFNKKSHLSNLQRIYGDAIAHRERLGAHADASLMTRGHA